MNITYSINEDHFHLIHHEDQQFESAFLEDSVSRMPHAIHLKKCAHPLSVMHITGEIKDYSRITYMPSVIKGVVVCIQHIKNGYLMEFDTSVCMEKDYARNIVDIRFISANIPFKFRYTKQGTLRRLDIYFPEKDVSDLMDKGLVSLLEQRGHFVINRLEMMSMSKKIETILEDSDNAITREDICSQVDKLVLIIKRCLEER